MKVPFEILPEDVWVGIFENRYEILKFGLHSQSGYNHYTLYILAIGISLGSM